jgi:hypothetical protein
MQQITTVTTAVPVVEEGQVPRQLRQLSERDQELAGFGRSGWALTHTATIPGPEFVMFVDTLTRDQPEQ